VARREHSRRDDEIGETTRTVSFTGKTTTAEATEFIGLCRHGVLGNTSVDYVIGNDERALREGRWRPHNAAELIAALNHLRRCLKDDIPRETLAVAALRAGRLHTEATAKSQWPIVQHGRTLRKEKHTSGRARGEAIAKAAAARTTEIAKLVRQHDADEHGPLVAWIAKRKQVSERTVRRHLKKIGQQRR
jgi:hypothetical protein